MMMKKTYRLSKEQELAVDVSRNIAVSAGAGSGKTTVLTARFLNLLESGLSADEIGAITFTEKAALEMKGRIRKSINEKILSSDSHEKIKWMEHLDDLGNANISTIHSFCGNIVSENAAYLGIDFRFSIINEIDMAVILSDAVKRAINQYVSMDKYADAAGKIADCYGRDYLYGQFISEIKRLRIDLISRAVEMEDMSSLMEDGSPQKLCMEIVMDADKAYMDYKKKNDVLDYNDLENMALSILKSKKFRDRYRDRFKSLLVDEFQDTNEIQKSIIYSIAADDDGAILPKKLFVVGDFKQSIYGFRGTDHTIFKRVAGDIGDGGRVSLNTCYRSRNEIIYEINSIFNALIEGYEDLKCPADDELKEKRINLITYKKSKSSSGSITGEVKKLLQGKKSDYNNINDAFAALKECISRPKIPENNEGIAAAKSIRFLSDKGLGFRDMCILVRSRYVIAEIEEELKKRNIPYCIIGGQGFYAKDEVKEMINLYRVLIKDFDGEFSPSDVRSFIKSLRGPLFQIPDSVIFKLKIEKDEGSLINLFQAMDYVADGMKECEDKVKLKRAYDIMQRLSSLKERYGVSEFFRAVIEQCDVFNLMLAYENGVQKVRNIEKLLRKIESIDEENLFTHDEFVKYIDVLYVNEAEDSEASLDTEDTDAVKIMTIHQAKGLEFRGVIIPKVHSDLLSMSRRDKPYLVLHNEKIIFSRDLARGEDNEEYSNYYKKMLLKDIDESIRLLYVAMTRAEEYLILSGEDDNKEPGKIDTCDDKIKNLNSFLMMIKYALNIKNAGKDFIGFYNIDEIQDIEVKVNDFLPVRFNREMLNTRLNHQCMVKPNALVSTTRYMDYTKCPRKYYLESILKVNGGKYAAGSEEIAGDISVDISDIRGADLGTVVHSILEKLNRRGPVDIDTVIMKSMEELGLDYDKGSVDILKHYVNNYITLESGRENLGSLKSKYNEYEYNLSVPEGGEAFISGFIDRMEIFENGGSLTVLITDYKTNHIWDDKRMQELIKAYTPQLQIYGKAAYELLQTRGICTNNILLEIYFLDIPRRVRIPYNNQLACSILKSMDDIFAKDFGKSLPQDFLKRSNQGECHCVYSHICR